MKEATSLICPGCDNVILMTEETELYLGDYWHDCCVQDDKQINANEILISKIKL